MKSIFSHLDKPGMFLAKSMTVWPIMRLAKATISERQTSSTVMKITIMMEKENLLQWRSKTLIFWS